MECKLCGKRIQSRDDIAWLEDVIVCRDCFDKEMDDNKGDLK